MSSALFYSAIGLIMIVLGLLMIINKISIVGVDFLTRQGSVSSGCFLIIIGIIIGTVGYHSLSPFGKIRKFLERLFEGKTKKRA